MSGGTIDQQYRTAVQLTAAARAGAEAASNGYTLATYLPDATNATLSYNFDVNQVSLNEAASFRSFDTPAPYGKTPSTENRSGKLPPISRALPVSELDELQLMNQTDAIGAKFEQYALNLGAQTAARLEAARGEAIATGKLELSENGITASIDYGRKPEHTVTAATLWSAAGAKPIDDLLAWIDVYTDTNGMAPGVLLLPRAVLASLSKNSDTIQASVGSNATPSRISYDDVTTLLNSYGIGQTVVYDRQVRVEGVPTRCTPPDTVILLPDPTDTVLSGLVGGPLGTTDFGIPAEAINQTYGIPAGEQAGIFAGAFSHSNPEGTDILSSAIALPVLTNANATFAAKVL